MDELYFVVDGIPENHLPQEVDEYMINYLSVFDKQHKSLLKKGINAVSIQPMQLKANEITIILIDYRITYKSKNYDFANGGGSTTIFTYSCEENEWSYRKTDYTGI